MKIQDAILYGSKRGSGSGPTPSGSIDISENGTYDVTDKAEAVVDVEPNLTTKQITQNGTYQASSDNADGYSSVTVAVPQPSGTKQVSISQNGTTTENVENYENAEITVNVQPNLTTKTITQNGTYQASGDNADGYSSVVVNTPSAPLEPGEVNFYDYDGTLLYVMTIAQARALQSLPPLPDHSQDEVPLTDAEWNWTLEELHDLQIPMDIAATYNIADNKFHYIIELSENELTLRIKSQASTHNHISIDFGDGTTYSSGDGTIFYTYASPGRKHIKTNIPIVIAVYLTTTHNPTDNIITGDAYAIKQIYYKSYSDNMNINNNIIVDKLLFGKNVNFNSAGSINVPFVGMPRGANYIFKTGGYGNVSVAGNVTLTGSHYISLRDRLCLKLNNTSDFQLLLVSTNVTNFCKEIYIQTQSKVSLGIPIETEKIVVKGPMVINWSQNKNLRYMDISEVSGMVYDYAFYQNGSISNVVFPNGITGIGQFAFYFAKPFFIDLPSTVTSIGTNAFTYCSLQRLICRAITPPTLASAFMSGYINEIYVPDESVEDYKAATNWSSYASKIYPLSEIEGE